jgi:nitroreductase
MGRRRFLAASAGAAAYVVFRPHLGWARRSRRTWPNLQPWSLPDAAPAGLDLTRALIGAAILAPSQWNSQPWRFEVDGPELRLVADAARALPVTDPARRGMMLSLGAALEHLLVAARAWGLRPVVDPLPWDGAHGVVARVTWSEGEAPRDRDLFAAITRRRTNRRDYDGRAITLQDGAQLMAQAPDGCALHWLDDRAAIRAVSELAYEAERAQVADRRAQAERFAWMRLDDDEARRRGDGVRLGALEFGGPACWFAGRYFNPRSRFLGFGADSAGKKAREQLRSSGALALLTTQRRGEGSWLVGGQMLSRITLKATALGLAHQPFSAPVESERTRGELLRRFGATGEDPLVLLRLGRARAPEPSPRRAVALVTSYRNT